MENKETGAKLLRYIENIEKFEEEKREVSRSITDTYNEAKSEGFDTSTIREVIKSRKKSKEEREQKAFLFETYAKAIGMQGELF